MTATLELPHLKWPSIQRLSSETVIITEKVDGTNAVIHVAEDGVVTAGSRNRWLTPEADNFGFAGWVQSHEEILRRFGPGYHYGEWYGAGIQRGYGLKEKAFASFDWWNEDYLDRFEGFVGTVPLLWKGPTPEWSNLSQLMEDFLGLLRAGGSRLNPGFGFPDPEGIVVEFKRARGVRFKKFCKNDHLHKSQQGPE